MLIYMFVAIMIVPTWGKTCHSLSDSNLSNNYKDIACLEQLLSYENVRRCKYAKKQAGGNSEICDVEDEEDYTKFINQTFGTSQSGQSAMCPDVLKQCSASHFNHRCFPRKDAAKLVCICKDNTNLPCIAEGLTKVQVGQVFEYSLGDVHCAKDVGNKEEFCSERSTAGPYQTVLSGMTKSTWLYCNHSHGHGGIVFQRRVDGSENFRRAWQDYANGFGDLENEFWLGNDLLSAITNQQDYALRIDMEDLSGEMRYAQYDYFRIDAASNKYKAHLGTYSGNAGDALQDPVQTVNQQRFTTIDQDNDAVSANCASSYNGGWWYNQCHNANPNGLFGSTAFGQGITWANWKGQSYSMRYMQLMLIPKNQID